MLKMVQISMGILLELHMHLQQNAVQQWFGAIRIESVYFEVVDVVIVLANVHTFT